MSAKDFIFLSCTKCISIYKEEKNILGCARNSENFKKNPLSDISIDNDMVDDGLINM